MTERKQLEDQLRHQAFHDALTGLANRVRLMDRLELALARTSRSGHNVALLFMDLDDFKAVNDAQGHLVGDEVLIEVARRVKACLRPSDTAARLGGDEFAVLLEDVADLSQAQAVGDRICGSLEEDIAVSASAVRISISGGIALGAAETTPDELLGRADLALYVAKNHGKGGFRTYEPAMHAAVIERLTLASDLLHALERSELVLHYQPIVAMGSGQIVGMEALLRWRHPTKGLLLPADIIPFDFERDLNEPGAFPFTRGPRANAGERGWIQRELSGEGDPRRANAQFKYLLANGQRGLDIIGDAPTQAWLDPDHPLAVHCVGTQGVSLCTLDDMRALYEGIPLTEISLSHSLPSAWTAAAVHILAEERGVDPAKIRGSLIQSPYYDEYCGYARHMPFELRMRLAVDSMEFCARLMPRFHSHVEDTYYISETGLDSVEEMSLGFFELRGLIRAMLQRGVSVDVFAPRLAFLVNCRMDVIDQIAKIRATRRLYARMMRDDFGAVDPRSLACNVTVHTSGLSLTSQQPANNIVRGALQALTAALAGVQAVEVSTFDEAYRTPSDAAHMVGLRTQQIIEHETNVMKVDDPLGGSYYLEALTNELEQRIIEMIRQIEALGEPAELISSGWFKELFDHASSRYATSMATGETVKIGVNRFTIPAEQDTLLRDSAEDKIEPYRERIDSVKAYRASRNASLVSENLDDLKRSACGSESLMPGISSAMLVGATFGEIGGVLREAYGHPAQPFLEVGAR